MGNQLNHKRWFGKTKRKVLLLGLEGSGKSTFLRWLKTGTFDATYKPTKDLEIENIKMKNLELLVFDTAGGERQRVFWRHHYPGSQGIIFLIDLTTDQEQQLTAIKEVQKVVLEKELEKAQLLIFLNKADLTSDAAKDKLIVESLGLSELAKNEKRVRVEIGSLKTRIKEGIEWLSKTMTAI